jgi:hypothetical protein
MINKMYSEIVAHGVFQVRLAAKASHVLAVRGTKDRDAVVGIVTHVNEVVAHVQGLKTQRREQQKIKSEKQNV